MQVTLYSMMSSDRRDDPGGGLLLYLRDGSSMKTVPASYINKKGRKLERRVKIWCHAQSPDCINLVNVWVWVLVHTMFQG